MILDTMKNKELYYKLGEGFKLGLEFIEKCKKEGVEVGKYELDGKNVYANVQEYNSKEEAKFENHNNYIDIQYIISGSEMMECAEAKYCQTMTPYNPDKDVEFFTCSGMKARMEFEAGSFAIFFPKDIHKPGVMLNEQVPVKKVVVKVHL